MNGQKDWAALVGRILLAGIFVISGFVITRQLYKEVGRTGRVSLVAFYAIFGDVMDTDFVIQRLTRRYGIAVKPYPSCALTHSAIDALVELRARHRIDAFLGGGYTSPSFGIDEVAARW